MKFESCILNSISHLNRFKDFVKKHADSELHRLPTVVTMDTIRRNSGSSSVVSYLVVGSESGEIIILDTQSFSILQHVGLTLNFTISNEMLLYYDMISLKFHFQARTANVPATPNLIAVSGQYDNDYHIVMTTREGNVCILCRGWLEGKPLFHMDRPTVGLVLLPTDQMSIVVCADQSLDCYSKKGKRVWGVNLPDPAICMTSIILSHVGQILICVALRGGLVQIYLNKVVVDHFSVAETVAAMTFGRLGQEDHVLVLITTGNLLGEKPFLPTNRLKFVSRTIPTIFFPLRPYRWFVGYKNIEANS